MRFMGCALGLLVLAGCSDDGSSPGPTFDISGRLTDADGAPVAGAAVILDYEFEHVDAAKALADLPEPVPVRFTITDACGDEVFYDSDEILGGPGEPLFMWDMTDQAGLRVPEGVYRFRVEAEGREPAETFAFLAWTLGNEVGPFGDDAAEIRATWRLDAVTDEDGGFTLERACWDFGRSDDWVEEDGDVNGSVLIPHRARLWFYPEGAEHGTPGPWFDVDPERGGFQEFALPPVVKPRD